MLRTSTLALAALAAGAIATPSLAQPVDEELLAYFRLWRKDEAKRRGVPAYVVMHDSSLEDLCRVRPKSLAQLRGVSGFGDLKTADFGPSILEAFEEYNRGSRPKQQVAMPESLNKPSQETRELLAKGHSFAEIANLRGRQLGTVIAAVANMVEQGEIEFNPSWVPQDRREAIEAVCARLGTARLRPVKEALPAEVTLGEVHLVIAKLRHQQRKTDS